MDMWTAIAAMAIGIAASISTRKILVARAQQRGALDAREVLARLAAIDARLARLEAGLEASAVEVERIGEAQRYLTRVLPAGAASPAEASLAAAPRAEPVGVAR